MKFIFPLDATPFEQVTNGKQLKNLLTIFLKQEKVQKFCKYRFIISQRYMYAKCCYCTAEFRFKKEGNVNQHSYMLWKLKNEHQHSQKKILGYFVQEAILDIPEQIQTKTIQYMIQKRFNISTAYFYRILNKVRNPSYTYHDLVNYFRKQGTFTYYEPIELEQVQFPSIFLCSTEIMRKVYLQYGQFCCFDFTYNLIKSKSKEKSEYRVGAFVGISNMMKIIPFALVIVDNEEKETIAKVFYQFFKMMGKKPKTFITDEQKSIIGALKLLKYENTWDGEHLFDSYHILKKIRHHLQGKQKIGLFADLMKAQNRPQYQTLCLEVNQKLNEHDKGVLEKFREHQNKYCFSQIPKNFVGFGVSSSISEKLNDLMKAKIPYSKNYTVVAKKLMSLFNTKSFQVSDITFQKQKVERYFNLNELKFLRLYMGKQIFKKLLNQISKTIYCFINSDEGTTLVIDRTGEFEVRKNQQNQIIDCSCSYIKKTGIPCSHIIKILLMKDQRIKDYIDRRWKIKILKLRPESRSKKTRRNRIK